MGTVREFIQRALVRAWGSRRGPVTVRVGWAVLRTSSITPRSAEVSGWGMFSPRGVRSWAEIRPTQSAFSSRRASSAMRFGVEILGRGWPEDQPRAQYEVDARAGRYAEQVEEHVVGEGFAHVLQKRVVDGEVRADAHDGDGVSQGAAQEKVDPARVPDVAPGEGVVEQEVAQDAHAHGEHPGYDLVGVEVLGQDHQGRHVDQDSRGPDQGELPETARGGHVPEQAAYVG